MDHSDPPPKGRWRRWRWPLAAAVVLVAAVTAGAVALADRSVGDLEVEGLRQPDFPDAVDDDGEADPVPTPTADVDDVDPLDEVTNVLLVGLDSRAELTEEQLRRLGTDDPGGARADSIMLAQLHPDREVASVLSFPRDLRVEICTGGADKINSAYHYGETDGRGGPTCLVETLDELTDVPIDHYIEIDFAGFIEVIDAVGGITVEVAEPLQDTYAGIDLPAGEVEMDGATALGYVRSRRADTDGDFGRARRQQQVLAALIDEAGSLGLLANPPRLVSVAGDVEDAVDADPGVTLNLLRRVAAAFRDADGEALDGRVVPGSNERVDGIDYVVLDEAAADELFAAFRDAEPLPDGPGDDSS